MSLLGDAGLATVAQRSAAALDSLVQRLPNDVQSASGTHFHETVISFTDATRRDRFLQTAREHNIFAGIALEKLVAGTEPRHLLVATTEMIEADDINDFIQVLEASSL
jgi:glycine dehydrogenase subunit 1